MRPEPAATPGVVRAAAVAIIAFVVVMTLHAGARVLLPVVEALVVWFVLNAIADGVERVPFVGRRLPRGVALVVAAVAAFVVGFLVVENSVRTVADLGPRAMSFREGFDPFLAWAADLLGVDHEEMLSNFAAGFGVEAAIRQVIAATVSTVSHFSIVAIYVAFLLVDQQFFEAKLRLLVPDPAEQAHIRALLGRIVGAIHAYLRVMAFVSILTAALELRRARGRRRRVCGLSRHDDLLSQLHPDHRLDPRDRAARRLRAPPVPELLADVRRPRSASASSSSSSATSSCRGCRRARSTSASSSPSSRSSPGGRSGA